MDYTQQVPSDRLREVIGIGGVTHCKPGELKADWNVRDSGYVEVLCFYMIPESASLVAPLCPLDCINTFPLPPTRNVILMIAPMNSLLYAILAAILSAVWLGLRQKRVASNSS